MDNIFQRLAGDHFSELVGLQIDASIPIPERLINEIIGMTIRGNKNISYCRISVSHQNRISVNLKTPRWPWPLELKLRLDRTVDVNSSPVLRAKLENKVLLGRLGSFFNVLPDGVLIQGNQVVVDLGAFFHSPEQKRFLDMVKSAEIRTEEGKLVLKVKAAVEKPS